MALRVLYCIALVLFSAVNCQYLDNNNCVLGRATLNVTSGRCECNAGLVGVGDLCCSLPDNKDVCSLSGDPILTSVKGQKVSLNIPCSVCIAIVDSNAANGEKCVLEVLASSTVGDLGAIYTSFIKVGVSINSATPVYVSLKKDTAEVYVNQQLMRVLNQGDVGGSGEQLDIGGENVVVKYDNVAKIWSLEGCDSSVSFRPHTPGQKLSPGACIQAKKSSILKTVEAGNICGMLASYDKSVPRPYGVLSDAFITRQIFDNQQRASHPDYTDICNDDIDGLMGDACDGISQDAMAKCGPILYNTPARTCLVAVGETGPNLLKLFSLCLETYCKGEADSCEALSDTTSIQACLPSFQACDEWPYYNDY